MPRPFRLALLQMHVEGGDKRRNLDHAERLIAEAAAGGAECVLLPEAEPIPHGSVCRRLADAARRHAIYVCSGLTEKDGPRVFNSAVLIDREGNVLLKHRKLNELDIGRPFYGPGDRPAIGCSLVIGPDGEEILQGPYGVDAEAILYVDVKPVC